MDREVLTHCLLKTMLSDSETCLDELKQKDKAQWKII